MTPHSIQQVCSCCPMGSEASGTRQQLLRAGEREGSSKLPGSRHFGRNEFIKISRRALAPGSFVLSGGCCEST